MRVSNRTILLAGTLFALNFYIAHELFAIEYLRFMGSIEGAFLGIARYAAGHWHDLAWFPLWYNGIPYQNTYPPLLHLTVALVSTITRVSPAHAYHFVVATTYCMGPVALFALALRFSGSRVAAFASGLMYSTLSFSAWIMPAIRNDLGSAFFPRRLQALVYYGEGPHVSSLMLLPLALLAVERAIERRRAPWFFLAAVLLAATALTNWFGAVSLTLAIMCFFVAKIDKKGVFKADLPLISGIGICAYFLAMPLLPPSTIALTQWNAKLVGGDFMHVYSKLPWRAGLILVALGGLKLVLRRCDWYLQFAVFFSFFTALLSISSVVWKLDIVPQATRYQLELEMALSLAIAFAARAWLKNRVAAIAMAMFLLALVYPLKRERNYSRNFLMRSIDITKTVEYKEAQWLNQNWTGERVMMSGSAGFFLTAFSDTPELAGGFDPGRVENAGAIALYEIYSSAGAGEHDAEDSLLWLKAMGVQAVGVSQEGSAEFYKAYQNPKKFDGVLPELWREGGDVIYRVGAGRMPLARIIPREAEVERIPINGIDVDPLRRYVAALDNPGMPRAEFEWTSAHSAKIHGTLQQGQVISVQEAWHRGWHANARISQDALGQMILDPGHAGAFGIDLVYDGGAEMKIAKTLRAVTAIALAILSLRAILKKAW